MYFSPRFCEFENSATADCLSRIVFSQSEVLLLFNASNYRKLWRTRLINVQILRIVLAIRTEEVNLFPTKPWFLRVCTTSLLKTLVTSNFSFSHSFSTHLENFLPFSSNLKLSSANSFSLEESKICRLGKG